MEQIMNFPGILSLCALLCLWVSARLGVFVRGRMRAVDLSELDEFGTVLGATLTLLGLLIGFTFSMAISRHDQRKNYEEEEANAIGTEYVRADLLPEPARTKVQAQLVQYLDLRIQRYDAHATDDVSGLAARTADSQNIMWNETKSVANVNPNPIIATVVVGMNDVLNRQGYTQAARLNRIPVSAWALMFVIALLANFLIGFTGKKAGNTRLLIVPLAVSISFLLIADIDSPQGGIIRIQPQNLQILADSLRPK
jgi:hypothetical protein